MYKKKMYNISWTIFFIKEFYNINILTIKGKIMYLHTIYDEFNLLYKYFIAIVIFMNNSVEFLCFCNIIDIQSKFDCKRIRATYLVLVLLLSRFNSWNEAKNFIKVDPLRNSPLMKFKG